jgi:hypothetical protein
MRKTGSNASSHFGRVDMNTEDTDAGLCRIWTRYRNTKFILSFSGVVFFAGVALQQVMPVAGLAIELVAALSFYFIWWRYVTTACPNCGQRFASVLGKVVFGFLRPTKCQACGLSAGREPD